MRRLASMTFIFGVVTATVSASCGSKVEATPSDDAGCGGASCDSGAVDSGALPDAIVDETPIDPPPPAATPTAKVDLLLVVDNSRSMGDKQLLLARHIPDLIKSLTAPDAKSPDKPIADLHIAVITSSLGSQGTSACDPASTNPHNDDRGHLLPRTDYAAKSGWTIASDGAEPLATACPAPFTASAMTWTYSPTEGGLFAGTAGARGLQAATSCVVESAEQDGCGYEETLESMYHFLIDPQPYEKAEVKCTFGVSGDACGTNKILVTGIDGAILAERKAFLREDSFLAVVILSDENDSSLKPAGLNWIPWAYGEGLMQRGWDACAGVPDDFEPETGADFDELHGAYHCYSCFENTANPNCSLPWAKDKLNSDPDGRNLREFHQVQRFGYNFFWGRQRYVNGFTQRVVPGLSPSGLVTSEPNPIFAGGRRSPSNVLVVAIVGVPAVLVNDPATGAPRALTNASWDKIISPDLKRRDPHMIESIAPRTPYGVPHFAGDRSIDPINGGDRDIADGDDLQYACIAPRDPSATDSFGDCDGPSPEAVSPLCDPARKQTYFKAYPGLRHLRMIHDLGAQGMAASICSASLAPVMRAIVDRMQPSLKAR